MTGIQLRPVIKPTTTLRISSSQQTKKSRLQWFYNLPVRSKQIVGLFSSEVISVAALMGVGAILIILGGRAQLRGQAQSELAVTEINYNIKINQMEFGFRGQSENTAIIEAALAHSRNQLLSKSLEGQVKQILQNEIRARQIEYATLVDKDLRIIVNANADRKGESFDPNNLVSQVLKQPKQITANQIVSWQELKKESPPLPEGLTNQDTVKQGALIRYTVTPVKDPKTDQVIAALVSGDIVNGKEPIVKKTLKTFNGGYSAVYLRQPSGEFALVTALDQGKAANSDQAQSDLPLPNLSLLEKAVNVGKVGELVTDRQKVGEQTYTMAAKALMDSQGEPVAVLVRGTSESDLNAFVTGSLLLQGSIGFLALATDVFLAILLGRSIAEPIKILQQTTHKFAAGDRQTRAEVIATDELGQLADTFNKLADNIVSKEEALAQQAFLQQAIAERSQLFAEFTSLLYKSVTSENILSTSVDGVRSILQTDRVVIYSFNEGWDSGTIMAESVAPGWIQAMGKIINDPLREGSVDRFKSGRVWVCHNVYEASLTGCHCEILERLQVKANMVAPILHEEQLAGLLCAHQCSEPRDWQPEEADLLKQLAIQIGFALNQSHLFEQLQQARVDADLALKKAASTSDQIEQARRAAELNAIEQRQQKEELQHQVLELLYNVENAAKGDLTVRAEVGEGEIGTVADFFNALIESLRQIVLQVKLASIQVNTAVAADEQAVGELAQQAMEQSDKVTNTLSSIEQMMYSIEAVSKNARQAADVSHIASNAALTSGQAMDSTVETIVNLRETVVNTANKVKLLGESSKEIAKVVGLVQEIAVQTNLLSVNAGIEASRAGEEGEGFRVVAEQVGRLATQSANAIKDIQQVIDTIQQETQEVVKAMEDGKKQVLDGTQMVFKAKQSLEEIVAVSHEIDQLVQSISNATVSQAETSRDVTDLIQEIAATSRQTSHSSGEVSQSLRTTVEVAQKLQMSVGQFKIGDE